VKSLLIWSIVVKPLMSWMHQYVTNRNVFRDCLRLFPPITGPRKLSGREFQTTNQPHRKLVGHRLDGIEAEAAEPVARYDYMVRMADRRCCRDATPATDWHNSTRYGGA